MNKQMEEDSPELKKMLSDMNKREKTRRFMMDTWLTDLQAYADKCTFWIFSVHYPWNHEACPFVPKSLGDTMTLMGDGFSMIRFRVIEGGKSYRLLQYKFRSYKNEFKDFKLTASDSRLVFRAMQEYLWDLKWDDNISEKQMREYMKMVGKIRCSCLKKAIPYIKQNVSIPESLLIPHSFIEDFNKSV